MTTMTSSSTSAQQPQPPLDYVRATFVESQPAAMVGPVGRCIAIASAAIAAAALLGVLYLLGPRLRPIHVTILLLLVGVAIGGPILLLSLRVQTIVEGVQLRLRIDAAGGVRLWRRDIPLAEIEKCEIYDASRGLDPIALLGTTYQSGRASRFFAWHGGVFYLVFSSARPAVLLTLTHHPRIAIRTADPEQLCAVIRARGAAAANEPGNSTATDAPALPLA